MLANTLPGIREIRGPLAAGYLWLVFGWLALGGPTSSELSGPVKELVDGAGQLPDSALLAAVSFGAYFDRIHLGGRLRKVEG